VTPSYSEQDSERPDHSDDTALKNRAEAFFGGAMSSEERSAFEHRLLDDPPFAQAVYTVMGMGPMFHEARQALSIRHLESHARIADRSISKEVPWWGRTRSRLVVTTLTAAIAFLVVFVSKIGEPPREDLPAGLPATAGLRGLSPSGGIEALPAQFTWPARAAADHYRFEIYDDSSQLIYATLTADTILVVAVDVLAEKGFRSGYWRVVPLDRFGAELESGEIIPIRVTAQ
jgi:hypothetical protein